MAKAKSGKKSGGKTKGSKKSKNDKKTKKQSVKQSVVKKTEVRQITKEEAKGIMRVCGQEVNGNAPIVKALCDIKGVGSELGHGLAIVIERELGLNPWKDKLETIDETIIEKIEDIVFHPLNYQIPVWMVNRRRDIETNNNMHMVANDLTYSKRTDIEREKNSRSWVGFRHSYGKRKVRGQRTKSKGRKSGVVGVVKKKGVK